MNILRHLFLLSSAGIVAGWAMVETDLATDPLIAGAAATTILVLLYFLLTLLVWLLRPFYPKEAQTLSYYPRGKLLGYDEHGDLRIDSHYPSRD